MRVSILFRYSFGTARYTANTISPSSRRRLESACKTRERDERTSWPLPALTYQPVAGAAAPVSLVDGVSAGSECLQLGAAARSLVDGVSVGSECLQLGAAARSLEACGVEATAVDAAWLEGCVE